MTPLPTPAPPPAIYVTPGGSLSPSIHRALIAREFERRKVTLHRRPEVLVKIMEGHEEAYRCLEALKTGQTDDP